MFVPGFSFLLKQKNYSSFILIFLNETMLP